MNDTSSLLASSIETICAPATPDGQGGVGIVRVSGPKAKLIAKAITGSVPKNRTLEYSSFYDSEGLLIDRGLAVIFEHPNSYTGEDILELHGHGGYYVQQNILITVLKCGARLANPGEFSERAFLNNKIDLIQAEAIADIIGANSSRGAMLAAKTLKGEFSQHINVLLKELIALRVEVEASIDFSDENIDFITEKNVVNRLATVSQQIEKLIINGRQGAVLKNGINVVIAGPPNAGKSSLLNVLSQEDTAIVTPIAGTTRDLLNEKIIIDDIPINITDTAGLRSTDDPIEYAGIERAKNAIEQADHIILVLDANDIKQTSSSSAEKLFPSEIANQPKLLEKTLIIMNKIDLSNEPKPKVTNEKMTFFKNVFDFKCIYLSAKESIGIENLKIEIKNKSQLTDVTENMFIAKERQLAALKDSLELIETASVQLAKNRTLDLIAEDLRLAQQCLGRITGDFKSDDLLGEIFSNFCIGK